MRPSCSISIISNRRIAKGKCAGGIAARSAGDSSRYDSATRPRRGIAGRAIRHRRIGPACLSGDRQLRHPEHSKRISPGLPGVLRSVRAGARSDAQDRSGRPCGPRMPLTMAAAATSVHDDELAISIKKDSGTRPAAPKSITDSLKPPPPCAGDTSRPCTRPPPPSRHRSPALSH
jgi:hypothetical protein